MPLYEIKCPECGNSKEVMIRLADLDGAVIEDCVYCGKQMERVPSLYGHYSIWGDNSSSTSPKRFDRHRKPKHK